MIKSLLYLAIGVMLLTAACKKTEVSEAVAVPGKVSTIAGNIVSVSGPMSASVNQDVVYHVTWQQGKNYTAFQKFKTDSTGTTNKISIFLDSSSCGNCIIKPATALYKFKPSATGTYYLKFTGRDSLHNIVDTLLVK